MNVYLFAVYLKTVLHSVSKESLGKACVLRHRLHNFYVVLHLRFKDTQRPKLFVKTQIVPRSNVAEHQWPVDRPLFERIPHR